MPVSYRTSDAMSASYSAFDADDGARSFELSPADRIGAPLRRRGLKFGWLIVLLIAFSGGWAYMSGHAFLPAWLPEVLARISAQIEQRAPLPKDRAPAAEAAAPPAIGTTKDIAGAPGPPPQPLSETAAAQEPTAAPVTEDEPSAEANATDQPQKLPEIPTPTDPLQKRAVAAGLHPDLSLAVLARLTPADFRNAGTAIKKALAETAGGEAFTWPRQHKARQAVFEVHFVAGASADCRRYVVGVTLDRWTTTALPMEKCGLQRAGNANTGKPGSVAAAPRGGE